MLGLFRRSGQLHECEEGFLEDILGLAMVQPKSSSV